MIPRALNDVLIAIAMAASNVRPPQAWWDRVLRERVVKLVSIPAIDT